MKVTIDLPVRFMDVDSEGKLRINTLLAYLQEAAIWHASRCGDSPDEIRSRGAGWALIKLGAEILGPVFYGDSVTVETWSRGSSGLKAYREFVVRSDGREIARGSSVWVYLNIETGRMMRIAPEHMAKYTSESELALGFDLDQWKPVHFDEPDLSFSATLRNQDIDTNLHVNNTQYAALADTAVSRLLGRNPTYKRIVLSYERAIEPGQAQAEAAVKASSDHCFDFAIVAEGSVCCRGQAIIAPNQP